MDFVDAFFASGIRFTTPILLAALGCLPTVWTRDLNVGLEGIMLFGAFFGVVIGLTTGSLPLAILLTLLLAVVAGVLFGVMITVFKVNVFVAGIVLNIFAGGATVYMLRSLFGVKGTLSDPGIPSIEKIRIPVIEDIPIVGPILSGQTTLTYVSWVIVALVALAVRYTVIVRRMKAAGEHPGALESAGGSVTAVRIGAQAWCFALCALAGLQLSMGQLTLFTEGMTSGLGFVALAAVIFCRGKVLLLAVMCILFGLSSAASVVIDDSIIPPQFAQMIPYVVAFVALVIVGKTMKQGGVRMLAPTMDD